MLFNMREGAKRASGAVTRLLHIVTFRRFVNVWMKLLLSSSMTHATIISFFTLNKILLTFFTPTPAWELKSKFSHLARILPVFSNFFDERAGS